MTDDPRSVCMHVTIVNPAIHVSQKKTSIIIRSTRSIADPLADLNPWRIASSPRIRNSAISVGNTVQLSQISVYSVNTNMKYLHSKCWSDLATNLNLRTWRHKILHCGCVHSTAARQWTDIFEIHTAAIATAEYCPICRLVDYRRSRSLIICFRALLLIKNVNFSDFSSSHVYQGSASFYKNFCTIFSALGQRI